MEFLPLIRAMSALLAEPSARLRSMVGSILDRSGDLCLRTASTLFGWRERIDPVGDALTPADTDRICAGVRARLQAEAAPRVDACEHIVITCDGQAHGALPPWTMQRNTVLARWQGTH